jgi:predicted transcriptional regulator
VPLIVDDEANSVSNAFGLSGFPFWVAVDDAGAVVFRTNGALSTSDFESLASALVNS